MSNILTSQSIAKSKLTPHQLEIYENIISIIESRSVLLRSKNIEDYQISLTGAAGTGKTFLTTIIAQYLYNRGFKFAITAPTHKAVGVMAGILKENNIQVTPRTIHSFLGIKLFKDPHTGEERFTIDKTKKEYEYVDVLIVDESSMISTELYEYILETIRMGRVGLVLLKHLLQETLLL